MNTAHMHNILAPSSLRQISANGLSFRVFDQGSGEPVLLLHGFPDDLQIWSGVIPYLLETGYRVIAFDQRGFGESSMPVGVHEYTTRQIVDDIPALLTALGIHEPVFVMGHDWGAGIAWGLTMFYPERVRALVAVSLGHLHCYGHAGLEQKLVKGFYTLWFQLRGVAEWYLLRGGGLARWLGNEPDVEQIIQRMSRPGRLTAGLSWYRAALLPVLFGSWPRIRRPTLGIWSAGDTFLTEAQMRNSSTQMDADWAYERIDGCGHWIPKEQPQRLAKLATGWFSKHA
jgi:pimeloyl-ACP methyl ester carboxylesterase